MRVKFVYKTLLISRLFTIFFKSIISDELTGDVLCSTSDKSWSINTAHISSNNLNITISFPTNRIPRSFQPGRIQIISTESIYQHPIKRFSWNYLNPTGLGWSFRSDSNNSNWISLSIEIQSELFESEREGQPGPVGFK